MTDDEQTPNKTDQRQGVKYNISQDICNSNDENSTKEDHCNSGYSNNPDELDEMTKDQVKK